MPNKAKLTPKTITSWFSPRVRKIFYLCLCVIFLLLSAGVAFETFFAKNDSQAQALNLCINNSAQAENKLRELPEVKQFLNGLKKDQKNSFVNIDMHFGHDNETRAGYAYVGEKTANNSQILFGKYLFLSGCSGQFQKETTPNSNYKPLTFDYLYKISQKTYTDETKLCQVELSKTSPIDFNNDNEPEYLSTCYSDKGSNLVNYYLYSTKDDKVNLLSQFKSSGPYEELTDLNNDGYLDIATTGIYMDEGTCKGNACFAPINRNYPDKRLLMRSYHYYWDPTTQTLSSPIKSEIYYNQDGHKIIVQPQ